jgi:hypothetical protein
MDPNAATELEFHPLAALFPPLDDAAFEALKADIREHGLREAIWLYEGKILDGTHRYKACLAVGVAPSFRDYEGGSPLAFVLGMNLRRRHLTTAQRALVAARIMPEFEAEAQVNMSRGGQGLADLPTLNSRDRAAEVVGVSSRLVGSAAQILGRGVPELVAAVERDQVKISAAAAIAGLRANQQAKVVAQGPRAIRAKATELRRADKAIPADGLSAKDRKWLAALPLWEVLGDNRAGFIREALFWKNAQPLLDRIRQAFPGLEEESPERVEPYITHLVSCVFCVHHPSRWELCFSCEGTGGSRDPRDSRCNHCRGDGFTITMRKWGEPPSTMVG